MAIGEPVMVDTARNPDFLDSFLTGSLRYPAFEEFYGMEDAIEQIVSYLKHAAQGWKKETNPVSAGACGWGKSSLAERLKSLMQLVPIYVLSANGERSPVNDHPFCLSIRRKMRRFWKKSMAFLAVISAPSCRRGRQNACMNLVAISLSSG